MEENSKPDEPIGRRRRWKMREAGRPDLDALHILEERAHSAPWPREAFEEELGRKQAKIWVIDDVGEARLAAMVVFWRVLDEVEILDIAVDPARQGLGLGRLLLETVIAVAATVGVKRIVLEVRVSNEPALRLYQKLGFIRAGRRPDYYEDNGEDAWIMAKVIEKED